MEQQINKARELLQTHEHYTYSVSAVEDGELRNVYTGMSQEDVDVGETVMSVKESHPEAEQINIDIRKPNGSSSKSVKRLVISVASPRTPQYPEQPQRPYYPPQPQAGMQGLGMVQPDMSGTFAKAQILEYQLKHVEKDRDRLEKKNEALESENERLKKENFELEKENKFKDEHFELERKGDEAERKGSLSGIVETVGSNPALANVAAMAVSRLMGVGMDELTGNPQEPEQQPAQNGESPTVYHKDSELNSMIGNTVQWLQEQEKEVVKRVYTLFSAIAKDPAFLDKFVPPPTQKPEADA
ncbi:hypothetical protein FUAX_09810 [Fulvitalea axinellae]|uniref:Uncharacterized protein n=1 Tax=Fulvitalea axinellae TaxID=1182444 RepID=A0AAU9C960_9BACT|nr:hypothetical protein FUAX_09810 [Fulvitalea axinellae]